MPLREAAWELDVHPETLRRAIAAGRLQAVRLGPRGWLKVRREDVERLIAGQEAEQALIDELVETFDATLVEKEAA
jgi:excisionase family DNA binding protein